MDIESFRDYCLSKKGVTESFPFDNVTLVFKVFGKMFALTDVETFESINLKCDPDKALQLRELYPAVLPGFHMNKTHWNTIIMDGSVSNSLIFSWTDHSYDLVVQKLSSKLREEFRSF
ncbi:MAG TPA: MmcQ/YjbR family DNA-binding protein [Bacteroidales bacterium]|nr:MmcQ/YjbR family DNA-binding protein [Bacteroidales bacterium]